MHTTPEKRIEELTARGLWGHDTLHGLLARQAANNPGRAEPVPAGQYGGGWRLPVCAALLGSTLVLHHPLDAPLSLQQLQDEQAIFTIAPSASK